MFCAPHTASLPLARGNVREPRIAATRAPRLHRGGTAVRVEADYAAEGIGLLLDFTIPVESGGALLLLFGCGLALLFPPLPLRR